MDNNYTRIIEQSISDFYDYDDYDIGDSDGASEFVLGASNFRPFNEGLIELLKRIGYTADLNDLNQTAEYLISQLKAIHSTIERETIFSWLLGSHRPKVEPGSRNRMYELCFALNLSAKQVIWFFEHVYYDRSFNWHTITEAVYYYCFLHQLPYDTAKQIIENVNSAPSIAITNSPELHTQFIRKQLDNIKSTDELTTYLINNKDSFSCWNNTALEDINHWYYELIGPDETKPIVDNFKKTLSKLLSSDASDKEIKNACNTIKSDISRCGLIVRNLYQDCITTNYKEDMEDIAEILSGKNTFKMAFVVNYLLTTPKGLCRNNDVPYIVKNNFPSKKVFSDVLDEAKSHSSQSYDAVRKTYILLKFFVFWYRIKLDLPGTEAYEASELPKIFREEIDSDLNNSGYPPLFAGNPYDWIFLCSAYSNRPIEFFSEVIGIIDETSNLE